MSLWMMVNHCMKREGEKNLRASCNRLTQVGGRVRGFRRTRIQNPGDPTENVRQEEFILRG